MLHAVYGWLSSGSGRGLVTSSSAGQMVYTDPLFTSTHPTNAVKSPHLRAGMHWSVPLVEADVEKYAERVVWIVGEAYQIKHGPQLSDILAAATGAAQQVSPRIDISAKSLV